MFPLPLLTVPQVRSQGSARTRERLLNDRDTKILFNESISALNFLSCPQQQQPNQPQFAVRSLKSVPEPKRRAMSHILEECRQAARTFFLKKPGVSRPSRISPLEDAVPKQPCQDHASILADDCPAISELLHSNFTSYMPVDPSTAEWIEADQVSLPDSPTKVPLLSLLPPALAHKYADLHTLLRPVPPNELPKPAMLCEHSEYLKLLHRMKTAGMLRWTTHATVVSGLFMVKQGTKKRLIIDQRPLNAMLEEPEHVELPGPANVASIVNHVNSITSSARKLMRTKLYGFKLDLQSYYYQLEVPESWIDLMCLPAVRVSELNDSDLIARFGADTMVYPSLRVLAMGGSYSVLLGHEAHHNFLVTRTPLKRWPELVGSHAVRLDSGRAVAWMAYVDDLGVIGTRPNLLSRLQKQLIQLYAKAGLRIKVEKIVEPTTDFDLIGIMIDGKTGEVGVSLEKRMRLRQAIHELLVLPAVQPRLLAKIVGHLHWAFLPRRPLLSVFQRLYRSVRNLKQPARPLSSAERLELSRAAALLPLAQTNINLPFSTRVIATDACLSGGAVVSARVPEDSVIEDVKCITVQPAPMSDPVRVPKSSKRSEVSPELPQSLKSAKFRTIIQHRWHVQEHVNVLEARSALLALRWVSTLHCPPSKILFLTDSAVLAGAASKGRSSSPSLLQVLRKLAAIQLATGFVIAWRHIKTDQNPADGPSRAFEQYRHE